MPITDNSNLFLLLFFISLSLKCIFINFGPTSSKNLWQNFAIFLEYDIGFGVHRFAGERPVHAGGT